MQLGDVEEHPASDDAVAGQGDGQGARPVRRQRVRRRYATVQGAVVDDVAQRVDMAVHIAVNVHGDAVPRELHSGRVRFAVGRSGEPVLGRIGVVRRGMGVDGGGQRHRTSRPHLADGRQHLFGADGVQGAPACAAAGAVSRRCR
uniref:Uncharacterized protein n=1 Tax=Streptomyces avermitilis TaxID=33903 RepID=A0A499VT83_STRAX|nr:hypothetical protein SAVMC3_22960 [Streptomyces avermitilis]